MSASPAEMVIRAMALLLLAVTSLPIIHAADLLTENFDSYTSAITTVPVGMTTGVKAAGQVTAVAGISQMLAHPRGSWN